MISAEELRKMPADADVQEWAELEIQRGCLLARRCGQEDTKICMCISHETACAVGAHLENLGYGVRMKEMPGPSEGEPCHVFTVSWKARGRGSRK